MKRRGMAGTVALTATIDEDGKVTNLQEISSYGFSGTLSMSHFD